LVALALTGCGADPPPRFLDAKAAANLHAIVLVVPPEPSIGGYFLESMSEVNAIAVSIATGKKTVDPAAQRSFADVSAHDKEFRLAMSEQNLHLGVDLQTSLAKALALDGYETSTMSVDEDKKGGIILDNFRNTTADAILYARIIGAAYMDGLDGGPFAPYAKVRIQLIDRKSRKILFERWYLYDSYASSSPQTVAVTKDGSVQATGEAAMGAGDTILRPATSYRFAVVDQILAHPALAAEGLRAGMPMISDDIGKALNPGVRSGT
jgi:hypothetical protein